MLATRCVPPHQLFLASNDDDDDDDDNDGLVHLHPLVCLLLYSSPSVSLIYGDGQSVSSEENGDVYD